MHISATKRVLEFLNVIRELFQEENFGPYGWLRLRPSWSAHERSRDAPTNGLPFAPFVMPTPNA